MRRGSTDKDNPLQRRKSGEGDDGEREGEIAERRQERKVQEGDRE